MYLLLVDPATQDLTTHPHDQTGTPDSTTGTDPVQAGTPLGARTAGALHNRSRTAFTGSRPLVGFASERVT
jgi:hypothetical protein